MTISKNPLVSVCIITYQHVDFIAECLDGALAQQTDFDVEILLGEDNSTDGTREICLEYAKRFPDKIRLFLHAPDRSNSIDGMTHAINNLTNNIQQAQGKYIAFCEGDDYWTDPEKLQKQVDFLEKNPEYVLCWTKFETLYDETGELLSDRNASFFSGERGIDFDFNTFSKGWDIGMQTLVFNRYALLQNNHLDNKYFRDTFLISDLLTIGKGYCINESMAVYRKHAGGICSAANEMHRAKTGALTYREIYKTYNKNEHLKLKYHNACRLYINCLIKNGLYKEALLVIDDLINLINEPSEYKTEFSNYIAELLAQKEKQLKEKTDHLHYIRNSLSFNIGRVITFPARFIHQLIKK